MFFLDMKSKGVEARPIKQISGGSEFNEVFFTDVRIPDSQRLGAEGEGWKVALTTLMNERLAVGTATGLLGVEELLSLARSVDLDGAPAIKNGAVREKIAQWYVESEGLKYTRYRSWTALSRGETPGPQSSISKVISAKQMQDLGAFAMELMGEGGIMMSDVPGAGAYQLQWMGGAGFRIAGGTDEILRNIIAERVLGLPQDTRVDKDITLPRSRSAPIEEQEDVRRRAAGGKRCAGAPQPSGGACAAIECPSPQSNRPSTVIPGPVPGTHRAPRSTADLL